MTPLQLLPAALAMLVLAAHFLRAGQPAGVFVCLAGIGLLFVWLPLGVLALWFIYRIARGWMALRNRKPMYA